MRWLLNYFVFLASFLTRNFLLCKCCCFLCSRTTFLRKELLRFGSLVSLIVLVFLFKLTAENQTALNETLPCIHNRSKAWAYWELFGTYSFVLIFEKFCCVLCERAGKCLSSLPEVASANPAESLLLAWSVAHKNLLQTFPFFNFFAEETNTLK